MKTEAWIRTQKRRVRKKYKKAGNVFFSPKEMRDLMNGTSFSALGKAVKNIAKEFQKLVTVLSEATKAISEAHKELEQDDCEEEEDK